jgi:hypothetical protein
VGNQRVVSRGQVFDSKIAVKVDRLHKSLQEMTGWDTSQNGGVRA